MATQPGILATENIASRYLSFSLVNSEAAKTALQQLKQQADGESLVVGIGLSLIKALGQEVEGLHDMPAQSAPGLDIPSTPAALWLWLRGTDRGVLFHRSRELQALLVEAFELVDVVEGFRFDENRDMSGYIDGTENPQGDEALQAAVVEGKGDGMDGSSFVAVQTWQHDFDALDAMNTVEKDNTIGRHISDNEEFDSAPESAHVKRAAQESYDPEAYILRRSMPWAEGMQAGLVFIAFGKSLDAFEAILHRMLGLEDGIHDALFNITRPVTGAYYWCPPMKDEQLDFSLLGL